MSARLLVTYGSWLGSTAEVAEAIGEALRDGGATVDVLSAREVRSVEGYDGVVLGAAVRAGQTHRDATTFLKRFRGDLTRLPVAYFVVCMTMKDDTPESRATSDAFLKPWREAAPDITPVDVGLFGGRLEYSEKASLPMRLLLKAMAAQGGDVRDWWAIRAWAEGLRPALMAA